MKEIKHGLKLIRGAIKTEKYKEHREVTFYETNEKRIELWIGERNNERDIEIEGGRMKKRVCGVKSSRSPRISVGFFTEFIFNEVALSHARWSSQDFREKPATNPPWPRQRSSSSYFLPLFLRREEKSEIRVAEDG